MKLTHNSFKFALNINSWTNRSYNKCHFLFTYSADPCPNK